MENQYMDTYWAALNNTTPIKSWEQALPATTDLLSHTTEIKIDGLPSGQYILLASTSKNFSKGEAMLGARVFYVSNISFVNNAKDYFLLNRENGQPLAAASVQVWEQKYDYTSSKYTKIKKGLYKSDANGFFQMQQVYDENKRPVYNQYQLEISYADDKLFMDDMINDNRYFYSYVDAPKPYTSIIMFGDRAIYRPGQTVYFKGIAMLRGTVEKKNDILTGYKTTIYLRDANGQTVDSLKMISNEFGSFSGKFQLPESGLNGSFSLATSNNEGLLNFRVEEYKRPKFYVDYEPLKGTYKVNEKIAVAGLAKAYAGNNIDGATVKYRVVRQPRYIYYWLFSKSWQPPTEAMEIAHGELKTDKDGKFKVEFTAIPDLKIDKKFQPVFDYTVYADITDINGETRSGQKLISVSYRSLILSNTIPSIVPVDSLKTLSISTENMNGEYVPALVKVVITKLKEEKRLIRQRYWNRPDQFIFSKDEYIRNFPYDEYNNEIDPVSWEKGETVFEKSDSSKVNSQFSLGNKQWTAGFYIIEISTKDKNGEDVKDVQYVQLDDEKSNQLSKPQYLWTDHPVPAIEPGQSASLKIGTSADNLFVIQDLDKAKNNLGPVHIYSYIKLNQEKRSISFSATEADRGGYGASWFFVKHNRVYQYNQTINVPWTNKDLSIEYATFRDKTLPGSEEKWKVKISGYKNEKVAAEMLASMYDASLDQFAKLTWSKPYIWYSYYRAVSWNASDNFGDERASQKRWTYPTYKNLIKNYDVTIFDKNNGGLVLGYEEVNHRNLYIRGTAPAMEALGNTEVSQRQFASLDFDDMPAPYRGNQLKKSGGFDFNMDAGLKVDAAGQPTEGQQDATVQIRKNFNETAFFFPDLRTDSSGAIEFSFTLPEALTKWKFQAMTHTKDLAFGYSTKDIVTQKELMVQPNAPRFLREGDKMEFSAKIVNLSDKEVTGQAELQLVDATTNQSVDGWFKNIIPNQFFTIAAGQSAAIKFPIEIPYRFSSALVWRIVAKAGAISDGEENSLPVLTNRMLVTETLPLWMRGTGTKNFTFDKLLKSGNSETLQQHALTVEYTSNSAWYAVQALPYLMEYPYECAEQTWNRYYANSLATFIANSSPRIKQIFEKWKITDTAALMSNLQKNQELKAVLLEETPWVMQAKTEAEQKKNIALLFDMIRMSKELSSAFDKLKKMQSDNGGFVWFNGGPDDRYMTQYIVTGIGHLKRLNSISAGENDKLKTILISAIPYLDKKIKEDYDALVKNKTDLTKYTPGYSTIQYLYMRSFFPEYKIAAASQTAYNYFRGRIQKTWTQQNKYMQGMIVLALGRTGDAATPAAILKSLKETSINNEELGMYWKDASRSWWWYEAPIERQALLIEAFEETGKDIKTADDLRTWLLKNKQTNNWETTKATAEACYALLLKGTQWLTNEPDVQIKLGSTVIKTTDQQEAGTGYIKQTIQGEKVNPAMGNISVTILPSTKDILRQDVGTEPSWGAVYWQYFEDLDKITTAATPLNLVKKLFVETNTDRGPVLTPVTDQTILKVGDKIKVRIELRVDRDMEYVHMKDMRASCLEPVNVLSNYKYQGGLGYYESTKDASTNFFFSNLRKGTYVFEYPLFVSHTGNFSNGVTSIQCMYAPEFASHSEGVRINVD
ncbi:MAG: alpha-2-macroglobulin family protein [Chitinophagaceae bacterium]